MAERLGEKTERKYLFHSLVHSANGHNDVGRARPKLQARNCSQVSQMDDKNQSTWAILCCSLRCIHRELDQRGAAGTLSSSLEGCWCRRWQLNSLCHSTNLESLEFL